MKIVVVDGNTLNPGDLSWSALQHLGEVEIYTHSSAEEVLSRCQDAQLVLTNKVVFDEPLMAQLPHLRYIGVTATGYNVVDVAAARERGIVVTNTPAYGTDSVAQFVFAQLLMMAQPVAAYCEDVSERWPRSRDFCYYDSSMLELAGKTFGVIGYGAIGRQVAHLARAFGMRVLIYSRTPPETLLEGCRFVALQELVAESDVISLHCPLTEANQQMVNETFLRAMKPTAMLINTARGALIDELALRLALSEGWIAAAALDVLSVEPPPADHPLFDMPNCYITPHIAWATREARQRLLQVVVDNLKAFQAGAPINCVS
ncbi:D-2-hydroxyacid dehydrogenase [Pseudomaricurvus sp. HS19]|nr:D-2-hydroxyacid dehydrogenase [Pseudomaricurvus sp. HS19]